MKALQRCREKVAGVFSVPVAPVPEDLGGRHADSEFGSERADLVQVAARLYPTHG
jgi:hypothetical protein